MAKCKINSGFGGCANVACLAAQSDRDSRPIIRSRTGTLSEIRSATCTNRCQVQG